MMLMLLPPCWRRPCWLRYSASLAVALGALVGVLAGNPGAAAAECWPVPDVRELAGGIFIPDWRVLCSEPAANDREGSPAKMREADRVEVAAPCALAGSEMETPSAPRAVARPAPGPPAQWRRPGLLTNM